jgi:hypothetical protein
METKEQLSIPTPKIILPGEYGYSFDGITPIGTFAVGAKNGCRGYLVYDPTKKIAGLAHVDMPDLDLPIIKEMVGYLSSLQASSLIIGTTPNSKLELTVFNLPIIQLPTPEFIYYPYSNEITALVPHELKKILHERLPRLKERMRKKGNYLIEV